MVGGFSASPSGERNFLKLVFAIYNSVSKFLKTTITLNGGSLGSCIDEERSKVR